MTSLVLITVIVLFAAVVLWCIKMPGQSVQGELPPLTDKQRRMSERLSEHVHVLAGEIGERHHNRMEELNRAADYIYEQFQDMGYVPAARQFGDRLYRNIVVELHGREKREEVIVIGAHYDTTWLTPGADDNASGVAGLLELARVFRDRRFARTVRFIAFANEEEPFYGTEDMGSRVSARRSRDQGEPIVAMFSLEMLGYYSKESGSQRYPDAIRPFYPEQGDFIAFVSDIRSSSLMRRAARYFREQQVFPSEGMAAPEWLVPDIRRSDNAAYWHHGYPAVMITDTANYRNPGYHNAGDTHRTLDYDSMARVVTGLSGMIRAMANE